MGNTFNVSKSEGVCAVYTYLFIETPQSAVLYNGNGQRYCTNSATYDCQAFYSVDEVLAIWACDTNEPIVIPVDGDGDGLTDDIDPDDMDACIPDSTTALCLLDSGTLPPFFETYPWLADILNPFDCGDATVTVYRSSGYVYLLVDGEGFPVLYNETGLRYCANSANYNCEDFYTIDEVIEIWNCENSLKEVEKDSRISPQNHTDLIHEVQLFPNPTTGNFSIQLPKDLEAETIQIIDLNGQVIRSLQGGDSLYQLELQEQEAGVYLVQVITREGVFSRKLIVQ